MTTEVLPASRMERFRGPLLVICVLRYVIPIVAIPAAIAWAAALPDPGTGATELLLLPRPGKEVLLGAGYILKVPSDTVVNLPLLLAAYVPGMVFAVWAFFALGRAYAADLDRGEGPAWLTRMVPPDRLDQARRVIAKRGVTVAIFGRIAALPPTIMAVAAGTTAVDPRRYLGADLAGALASFAITVAAGYGLGEAYERGGRIFLIVGIVLLVAGIQLFTRWLDEEADEAPAPLDTDADTEPA